MTFRLAMFYLDLYQPPPSLVYMYLLLLLCKLIWGTHANQSGSPTSTLVYNTVGEPDYMPTKGAML